MLSPRWRLDAGFPGCKRRLLRKMPPAVTIRTVTYVRCRYVSRTLQQRGASERTRVQLCGRLSVELDGGEIVAALRGRQVRLLLAYLVIHRERRVGREELIGVVWPETAPDSQDAALRTLLSRLRSVIGPEVLVGRDELTLALPEPAWIDLEAASRSWPARPGRSSTVTRAAPGATRRSRSTSPDEACCRAPARRGWNRCGAIWPGAAAGAGDRRPCGTGARRLAAELGRARRPDADRVRAVPRVRLRAADGGAAPPGQRR